MPLAVHSKFIRFNASKWLSVQLLVEKDEMQSLLDFLGDIFIFPLGCVLSLEKNSLSKEEFIDGYTNYIDALKIKKLPQETEYRPLFSTAFSLTEECFYSQPVGEQKHIIRAIKPVVQLQAHSLNYSKADGKFHDMVFGNDSILWGIQFSYPQFCEDVVTYEPYRVDDRFINTLLFKNLQKWVRTHTIPTPFQVEDKTVNVPMRIGRACLEWINNHPQLIQKNISVKK